MADRFMHEDFMLTTPSGVRLYHDYACDLPIIDYHCHLPPQQVADDYRFRNLTEVWLGGDHYKWRLMRTNGIDEKFVTGESSDWEKFEKWAETVPLTVRNPMYHWVHLELDRIFGVTDRLLNPATARSIYDDCNEKLAGEGFTARGIMKMMNVVLVCTTDDPIDDLASHKAVAEDASFDIQMLPTWRPDKAMAVESPERYNAYIDKLSAAADVEINSYARLLDALRTRHAFFHEMGCRLSDHGIETVYATDYTDSEVVGIFDQVRSGKTLSAEQIDKFKSAMLHEFAVMDHERNWTQQIHYGAIRDNNGRMFKILGPDTGFDAIGDFDIGRALSRFLDRLDGDDTLPKTILYNLNPRDNELLVSLMGCFQDGRIAGKLQFGSGWWFLDNIEYMTRQMEALSNMGMIARFVGMLTDSRSFLSYTRHEYFRRLVCDIFGREMDAGLLPKDFDLIGGIVAGISYHNAAGYFGFDLPAVS